MIITHILHLILGIILFFIVNWVGKHSYSVGYMQISMFLEEEESPAFNFIFRIISPLVYIFIASAILYGLDLDEYVKNIYFISIYYISFRLIFNLLTNRGLLMNWKRQFIYWITIISTSYFSYTKIIIEKENLLPKFETISNKIWIIIIVFLFHTMNRVRFSSDNTIKRKDNYLNNRLKYFKNKYGEYINENVKNDKLKSIIFAIIIYENFNRPKIIRIIENISFFLSNKKHSLGVMQVQTEKFINDRESVELGVIIILNTYNKKVSVINAENYFNEYRIATEIIEKYNNGESYSYEVSELSNKILKMLPKTGERFLIPKEYRNNENVYDYE